MMTTTSANNGGNSKSHGKKKVIMTNPYLRRGIVAKKKQSPTPQPNYVTPRKVEQQAKLPPPAPQRPSAQNPNHHSKFSSSGTAKQRPTNNASQRSAVTPSPKSFHLKRGFGGKSSFRQQLSKEINALKRAKKDKLRALEIQKRHEERKQKQRIVEEERLRVAQQQALEKDRREAERIKKAQEKEEERQRKELERQRKALEKEAERNRKEEERKRKAEERQRKEEERQRLQQERYEREERARQDYNMMLLQQQRQQQQQQEQYLYMQQVQMQQQQPYAQWNQVMPPYATTASRSSHPFPPAPLSAALTTSHVNSNYSSMVPTHVLSAEMMDNINSHEEVPSQQNPESSGMPPTSEPTPTNMVASKSSSDTAKNNPHEVPPQQKQQLHATSSNQNSSMVTSESSSNPAPEIIAHDEPSSQERKLPAVTAPSNPKQSTVTDATRYDPVEIIPQEVPSLQAQLLSAVTTQSAPNSVSNVASYHPKATGRTDEPKIVSACSIPPYQIPTQLTVEQNQNIMICGPPRNTNAISMSSSTANGEGVNANWQMTQLMKGYNCSTASHLQGIPQALGFPPQQQPWGQQHQPSLYPYNCHGRPFAGMVPPATPSSYSSAYGHPMTRLPMPATWRLPQLPSRPRFKSGPRRIETPKVLCEPLEFPSPFSQSHSNDIITIVLIRSPNDKSFGVSLKIGQKSTLVDPDHIPKEKNDIKAGDNNVPLTIPGRNDADSKTEHGQDKQTPVTTSSSDSTSSINLEALPVISTEAPGLGKEKELASADLGLTEATSSSKIDEMDVCEKRIASVKKDDALPPRVISTKGENHQSDDVKTISPRSGREMSSDSEHTRADFVNPFEATGKENLGANTPGLDTACPKKDSISNTEGSHSDTMRPKSAVERTEEDQAEPVSYDTGTLSNLPILSSGTGQSKQNLQSADAQEKSTDIVAVPPKPRRRRRRRLNFMVMMVTDADAQNNRHQTDQDATTTNLLQPDDIILSVGGTNIAGMTFAEACGFFSKNAKSCKETGEVTVRVNLTRRKPKAVKKPAKAGTAGPKSKFAAETTLKKSVASPLSLPLKKLAPPNKSSSFSTTELALLAESIMKAIHSPNRLLGQSISEELLTQATYTFRKVAILQEYGGLTHRDTPTLQQKWERITRTKDSELNRVAKEFWSNTLAMECGMAESSDKSSSGGNPLLPFSTDVRRNALRRLPRPVKGCRCGALDHEYLHDPNCTLYIDIRKLVPKETLKSLDLKISRPGKRKGESKNLNKIKTAVKDRIDKIKTTSDLEEAEARFVAHMEEVQVKELKKAVFSPNLTSMVLSSVFELQREFPIQQDKMQIELEDEDDSDDDSDDEDSEGKGNKRKGPSGSRTPKQKKRKISDGSNISFKYVIRMLGKISRTWGHVFREPSHEDYAWRWEVFHGHNSETAKWESHSKNPRRPNRYTFENFRFVTIPKTTGCDKLSDAISNFELAVMTNAEKMMSPLPIISNDVPIQTDSKIDAHPTTKGETGKVLKSVAADQDVTNSTNCSILACHQNGREVCNMENDDKTKQCSSEPKKEIAKESTEAPIIVASQEQVDTYSLAAHYLSPASSGVYDEILAFIKQGVLHASTDGIPYLAPEWASKVDVIVLDDMASAWGTDMDPDGQHCVHFELRDTLEEQWMQTEFGWSLAEDPDDIIFDVEDLQNWRKAFEGKVEEKEMSQSGIGRFGL